MTDTAEGADMGEGSAHNVYDKPGMAKFANGAKPAATEDQGTRGVEVVYYVRLDNGNIKIGTSRDLLRRIRSYGLGKANRIGPVLAVEFGGRDLERRRHFEFRRTRVGKSEQFKPSTGLIAHIKSLRQQTGVQ